MTRRILAAVLALSLLLPAAAAAAETGSYPDVPAGSWAEEPIRKAAEYALMEGLPDGSFGYGGIMSRGSFVVVLSRMFGWEEARPAVPSFSDVGPGDWYYSAVEAALQNGVVDQSLYFRPDDDISREDMAVMLVRALGYGPLAASQEKAALPFGDVTENRGYIALAYHMGIVSGVKGADGALSFLPAQSSTRQEAAAMLVRVYERRNAKLGWLHGFYAMGSYPQIAYADEMDAVSLGWARMSWDAAKGPYVNQSSAGGNEWSVPAQSELATDRFQENQTPYNLDIYASTADKMTLADGTASSVASAVLATPEARSRSVDAILAAAKGYSGVTVDFEGLGAELKAPFTAFITALRSGLPAGQTLYVCVQPPDWYDGYDYRALGNVCDKVILMAHDYQDRSLPAAWVGSVEASSAPAPLNRVYEALVAATDPETGVADRSKLALAISFSTPGHQVNADGTLASTALYSPGVATLMTRLRQSDSVRGWDAAAYSPYVTYTAGDGKRYRVWYEDERSVTEKIGLARMFGVDGVSLWRMGIIPDDTDAGLDMNVWSALLAER